MAVNGAGAGAGGDHGTSGCIPAAGICENVGVKLARISLVLAALILTSLILTSLVLGTGRRIRSRIRILSSTVLVSVGSTLILILRSIAVALVAQSEISRDAGGDEFGRLRPKRITY